MTSRMDVLIATRNLGKLAEFEHALAWPGIRFLSLRDVPDLPEVEETGDSFVANALLKAESGARHTRGWCLADDSGIEVAALGGAPGVRSARYAGVQGDDRANNAKLLAELASCDDRSARFRCVLALAAPDGRIWTVEGVCKGRIEPSPRGARGFGYDPLFRPHGAARTFGEMGPDEKLGLSHRGAALREARAAWIEAGIIARGV